MRISSLFAAAFIFIFSTINNAQETDKEGSQDHPLLSRIPGYYISEQIIKDFDVYTSPYIETENVWEGKLTQINYSLKEGSKEFSFIQIIRNYENAVKKLSGKILLSETRILHAKIEKNKAVTYISVEAYNDGRDYTLIIVESKPMEDEVTIDSASLNKGISELGKVAVYGIYFDTGKSVVKPESKTAIDEIVKLLKQNPQLKLFVVGHTDTDGILESNMKLSSERAASVVKALIENGIQAARLKSSGVGPYCPVESNKTEVGKAKNRRVELVEMF
ncbi:MAG: OmpA family protein [Ignavibacteriaceae bacterium]|nr:OmpA family protein [Ignavibacteriaceae bacterium]